MSEEFGKKYWISVLKQAVTVFFVGGIGQVLVLMPFFGPSTFKGFLRSMMWTGIMWVVLWIGNGLVTDLVHRQLSWIEAPLKSAAMVLFSTFAFTILATLGIFLSFSYLQSGESFRESLTNIDFGFFFNVLVITTIITLFMHGRGFLNSWRDAFLEAEKLKRAHLASQYESLKNQVNPHFLFNSFNVLSTLVYKDQDLAAKFIKQLSDVYRYVLESKDKEVVPLSEELEALNSYIFLAKMRYGDNFEVEIELDNSEGIVIAPLSLQMLVENAIKHNIISKAQPLKIKISIEEEAYILVENNLQEKNNVIASVGIGLPNIIERYQYIAEKEVKIEKTENTFKVFIPIINYSD